MLVFVEAGKVGAAILAGRVVATLKEVKERGIVRTVDRADIYEAQTPQVFRTELIREAYANIDKLDTSGVSDDSQLVEAIGGMVSVVETDATNIKITTYGDVAIAEAILKIRAKSKPQGYIGPYGEAQW